MELFLEILAWVSNIAFSLAAIPQLIQTIKDDHANGLTWGLVLLWLVGEAGGAVVVWDKNMLAFLISYLINTLFLIIIVGYKLKQYKSCRRFYALFFNNRNVRKGKKKKQVVVSKKRTIQYE